jgi:hypothetical protein
MTKKWRTRVEVDRVVTAETVKGAIDEHLAAIEAELPKTSGSERRRLLLRALNFCSIFRPLPYWLLKALSDELIGLQPSIDDKRWWAVRTARDELALTWDARTAYDADGQVASVEDGAYHRAAEELAGTDAAGTARTMRHSYDKVERALRRKGLGRPRAYRRRPPRQE